MARAPWLVALLGLAGCDILDDLQPRGPECDQRALFWPDADGDGVGDDASEAYVGCEAPEGFVDVPPEGLGDTGVSDTALPADTGTDLDSGASPPDDTGAPDDSAAGGPDTAQEPPVDTGLPETGLPDTGDSDVPPADTADTAPPSDTAPGGP